MSKRITIPFRQEYVVDKISFWAKTTMDQKPGIDVLTHNLYVGHVALVLAERYSAQLAEFGLNPFQVAFLAACHDCGKIHRNFQKKCPAWLETYGLASIAAARWRGNEAGHGEYSRDSLALFLHNQALCDEQAASYWSAVIGAHHGKLLGRRSCGELPEVTDPDKYLHLDWEAERQEVLRTVWEQFGSPLLPHAGMHSPEIWLVGGLVTLADWIGSDENCFPADKPWPLLEVPARAEQAIARLGLGPLSVIPGLDFFDIFHKQPYELQARAACTITRPGVYVLEAPMGMGKTEAALFTAYRLLEQGKATGIYFALPTQATSNRMHLRLEEFARAVCPKALQPRLIHSTSWLRDEVPQPTGGTGDGIDNQWFASSKRALLAPLGVGTVDQALLAVVAARHFFLRRFALAGKVVILDEVHSYDMYTGTLITFLCRELENLGCTVIVLSATLTSRARADLLCTHHDALPDTTQGAPPALLSFRQADGSLSTLSADSPPKPPVNIAWVSQEDALQRSVWAANQGARVLWICDTVDSAQATYAVLQNMVAPFDLGLLHSRFPLFIRQALEEDWLNRLGKDCQSGRGAILVSTQIVEQSVDIDADLLVTELAPSDMLLQRMGRLHRHDRGPRLLPPQCLFLRESASLEQFRGMKALAIKEAFGPKASVYAPFILLGTLRTWENRQVIHLPGDIRPIMAETYSDWDTLPPEWEKLAAQYDGRQYAQKQMAAFEANVWNASADDREGPQTRQSEFETRCFALYTGQNGSVRTMLGGGTASMAEDRFHLPTARAVALNTVRLPAYLFEPSTLDKKLRRYGADDWALVKDGSLHIPSVKSGCILAWHETTGVRILKI